MLIAHDLGTTGNKASLHHDDGRLVTSVTVPYPAHFAAGGIAEQDPADWWDAVASATRHCSPARESPPRPSSASSSAAR